MSKISGRITGKEYTILIAIVLVDLITKLAANYFLPFKEKVSVIGERVCLHLTYNQDSTGGQVGFMLQDYQNKNLTIVLSCLIVLILLSYVLFIRKQKIRTLYKTLIGVGLFVILSWAMGFILPLFENVNISSWTTSVIGKLVALAIVFCIFFYFSLDKWIRLSLVVVFAAGIGNFLSHFYPPYRIVDFIYIKGSYELVKIGIFNVADLALYVGSLGLIVSALFYELIKGLKNKKVKRQQTKEIAGQAHNDSIEN